MAEIIHSTLIRHLLEEILIADYPLAKVYEDSFPGDASNLTLLALMRAISPQFDDQTHMKRVMWQITIVSTSRATSKAACELVWEALKDVEYGSGETGTDGKKVLITATTLPSYDGVDETGNPMYSVLLQLTSRH